MLGTLTATEENGANWFQEEIWGEWQDGIGKNNRKELQGIHLGEISRSESKAGT